MKKMLVVGTTSLAVIALLAIGYWRWQQVAGVPAVRPTQPDIVTKPDPIVGFLPDGWQATDTKEEALEKIHLPFLHRQLIGQQVRVVRIKGNGVIFKDAESQYRNTMLTDGKIVILAKTGQLLRIELFSPNEPGPFPGQASLEETEERYRNSCQMYESLPAAKQRVTFQAVLNRLYGHKSVQESKRIEGVYVVFNEEGFMEKTA